MIRVYELSDEEYNAVMDALELAEEKAVLDHAQCQLHNLQIEIHEQHTSQDGMKATNEELRFWGEWDE